MDPNILVTSYTAIGSPSQKWGGDPKTLDLETYDIILEFLVSSHKKHINLIGGDPVIHPDFFNILQKTNKWCKNFGMTASIYTSGIYLEKYIPYIGNDINIVISISALEYFNRIERFTDVYNIIEQLNNLDWFTSGKAICQFELYPYSINYDYIENLFKAFQFKQVKVNFSPKSFDISTEEYYLDLKKSFLQFCLLAQKYHTKIIVDDYNSIPLCYFNKEEEILISDICENYPQFSKAFKLVILPDLTCSYDKFNNIQQNIPMHLNDFSNFQELQKYLLLKIYYPLVNMADEGRCLSCPHAQFYKCDTPYLFASID